MSDNFEREEVIELAERIFLILSSWRSNITDENTEQDAKKAIRQAMIFRKVEREIFEENKDVGTKD